jgi:DNA damage-inducible protein 1
MENQKHTSKHEFIFGLDMLRRHQCCIDLKRNKLCLGEGEEVRFLQESELPDGLGLAGPMPSNKRRREDDDDEEESSKTRTEPTAAPPTTTTSTSSTTTSSNGISLADLDFAMSSAKRRDE